MRGGIGVGRLFTAAAAVAPALVAAAHIVPAGTWLSGPRRAWLPALAGIGSSDHVALTFDDGPDPRSTPAFLAALDELAVRATFFVLGEQVLRHRRLTHDIVRRGHELAVHGWTHDRPWRPAPVREARRLARTARAVAEVSGVAPTWYRPPYGVLTGDRLLAARRIGLRPVLWTAWGRDWTAHATAESVVASVLRELRGGGTVVLHDTDRHAAPGCWRAALAALPCLVDACRAAGLTVGSLGDHGVGGRPAPGVRAERPV
ncbi:polysaccharide deacetylase family protein [Streptomyces sp. NK08204]|uniref:polysaccharide deacetylase family protein n=1 Tax=Streptomyces sp. NK08204 TaxID=2873260 RepID=UPI001CED8750|nr:polysaccharide deacetylase family protein [Streptomyces sp. NK08204]